MQEDGKNVSSDTQDIMRKLRADGQRYRDLFERSPLGIYQTSIDGRVLLANPALVKMLGYDSFEELSRINVVNDSSHPDYPREDFVALFDNRDEIIGFETCWVAKDGEVLHIRENARAIRDEQGNITGFEGTVENITKRRKVEKQLEARLQYENLIASMSSNFANALLMEEKSDAVINEALTDLGKYAEATTATVVVAWAGAKCLEHRGFWSADLQPMPQFLNRVDYEREPWALRRLLRNEMVYVQLSDRQPEEAGLEHVIMQKLGLKSVVMAPWICSERTVGAVVLGSDDEDKVWNQDLLSALKIAAELVGSAYERRTYYDKLHEEQKLVRAMMNNTPDRIYFKDRQCRFIRANRALCERHNLSDPEAIVGKTDRDLFTSLHAEQAMEDDMHVMSTGIPIVAKEELETWVDGSETWASTTKVPMYDDQGEVTGLMGISRDITDWKLGEKDRMRLELQMMQAQKMESLGVMCGGIAHDFNNFLMGILGNAGLALIEMAPESPAWNSVKQIETVALRAAELTNQLLAYSGKTEPERRVVHVSRLVKEMAHLLRVSIPKTTQIEYDFKDDLPGVYCDPVQLRQVVMNLMINASDAIEGDSGSIEVSTGITQCDEDTLKVSVLGDELEPGEYVYVKIKDNGVGMDRETMDRIFDPFFTTKPTGHGLGMPVVVGVVKAHKGTILVESSAGEGTEFTVLLPSAGAIENDEEEGLDGQATEGAGMPVSANILIVEDDEIVRAVARKILENCGYEVTEACDGDAALKVLKDTASDEFGLIMLDVTLPGTSGKEVLKRAKETKKDIPIILMSGYNEDCIRRDFGISGYDGFLKKPFDAVSMTDLVAKCCDAHGGAE